MKSGTVLCALLLGVVILSDGLPAATVNKRDDSGEYLTIRDGNVEKVEWGRTKRNVDQNNKQLEATTKHVNEELYLNIRNDSELDKLTIEQNKTVDTNGRCLSGCIDEDWSDEYVYGESGIQGASWREEDDDWESESNGCGGNGCGLSAPSGCGGNTPNGCGSNGCGRKAASVVSVQGPPPPAPAPSIRVKPKQPPVKTKQPPVKTKPPVKPPSPPKKPPKFSEPLGAAIDEENVLPADENDDTETVSL
uniref:Uncharacterized protein n=1 Tax=Cacopsylla melanoneura TaxID=428564 RepID=A0A8D9BVK0_9HEMI